MDDKISVIIPTYKRSEFLTRAIDSVLNQTHRNVEIIVVDDNGIHTEFADKTKQTIQNTYAGDARIIYIQNETNAGGAESRNRGARAATGKYLCFLDDDDIYLPEKLEKQSEFMDAHGLELSFTDVKMYDEKNRLVDARDFSRYIDSWDNSMLLKKHLMHHLTPTITYMFLTEAFWKTGGFHTRKVSQEFMLMLDSIEMGLKIGYLSGIYCVQYIHSGTRISQAKSRLSGDNELYQVKQSYFDRLTPKEIQYIKFRYHIVLAVYFLRNRQIGSFLSYGIKAFFISPVSFVKEGLAMAVRVKELS